MHFGYYFEIVTVTESQDLEIYSKAMSYLKCDNSCITNVLGGSNLFWRDWGERKKGRKREELERVASSNF